MLISMAVLIALSLGLIPLISLSTSPGNYSGGGAAAAYYYSGSEYHLLGYSYNTFGQPVQGTELNVTVSSQSGSFTSTSTTNSSGFAEWTLQAPAPKSQTLYSLRVNGMLVSQGGGLFNFTQGEVNFLGGQQISLVTDAANSSRFDVIFFSEGDNGTVPTGYGLYYNYTYYSSGGIFGLTNKSQMTYLGGATGYVTLLKLPPAPKGDNTVSVAAFNPGGELIAVDTRTTVGGTLTPPSPRELFTSLASSILSLVVPLMAILVSYNSYGKDKATGVLDSVLTRPVTRRGLGLTRYVATLSSMTIAIAVTVGAMAAISQVLLGATIPLDFALVSVGGLVVEAAAFLGLMMAVSHVLRSTGGLIGTGVVLWVFLDFLWGIFILFAAQLLGVQAGSGDYLALSIQSGFVNPAQFYGLVGEYLNGVSLVTTAGQVPISPATYGLTPITLVLTAAFWVLAPLGGFLYMAVRRD